MGKKTKTMEINMVNVNKMSLKSILVKKS